MAVAVASRQAGEDWFCFEHPDRDTSTPWPRSVAPPRSTTAAPGASGASPRAGASSCGRRAGEDGGAVAVGGFAFSPDEADAEWAGFEPPSLHVPEVALARRGERVTLTLAAVAAPDDDADSALRRAAQRAASLGSAPLPLLDPDPTGRYRVVSAMPPEHYESAVARAVERIRAGALDKVVLAREVQVHAPRTRLRGGPRRPARGLPVVLRVLAGRGESAFVAASPELLVRRDGLRAGTLALAGSTRRSADPAVDDHLGEQLLRSDKDREEQAVVTRRRRPGAAPGERVGDGGRGAGRRADGRHPAPGDADPRAAEPRPVSAMKLAGMLHPTPAVGGEPFAAAAPLIPALEGLDRGWYAGPVGWTDANEDGGSASPCARAAQRAGGALLRGIRRGARLGPRRGRAGRDRGQAAGAAAGPRRLISGPAAARTPYRRTTSRNARASSRAAPPAAATGRGDSASRGCPSRRRVQPRAQRLILWSDSTITR